MPGLYGVLNMAKWTTLSQLANIEVVSHNIANVNTPGFSRQKLLLETRPSVTTSMGQMGTGVKAVTIQRMYDSFINSQLIFEKQILGNWQAREYAFKRMEEVFSLSSEYGLGTVMGEFWNVWQALAVNPSGRAERIGLASVAETMASDFNSAHKQLYTIQADSNAAIKGTVDSINVLADQISGLNKEILAVEIGPNIANDSRDKRDMLLEEMAGKIGISSFEDENGQISVLMEIGRPLVQGAMSWHLEVRTNAANGGFYDVRWDDGTGSLTDSTKSITRGELGGLLEMRDTTIPSYIKKVNKLAAGIINEVNKLHYYGYGLEGSTEKYFFNPLLSVSADVSENNTGGASISSGTVYDNTVLTLDDYEVRFTGAATFEIYNVTDGTQVMDARINGAEDLNDGNFAYTSGSDIEFEGIRVVITGAGPANGDVFTIDSTENAAKDMTVNPAIVSDVNKIAASQGAAGDDNLNALDIASLGDGNHINNNTSSFGSYYNGLVSEVGSAVADSSRNLTFKQNLMDHLNTRRESISGVSLDEETINLIRFQQAYTAAARMIGVIEEMLDELMNII